MRNKEIWKKRKTERLMCSLGMLFGVSLILLGIVFCWNNLNDWRIQQLFVILMIGGICPLSICWYVRRHTPLIS